MFVIPAGLIASRQQQEIWAVRSLSVRFVVMAVVIEGDEDHPERHQGLPGSSLTLVIPILASRAVKDSSNQSRSIIVISMPWASTLI